MRFLLIIFLTAVFFSVIGQAEHQKIKIYKTVIGKIYNEREVDSIRYKARDYVGTVKIRETSDSIYYSINHFDKYEVADRYQAEGSYCGNTERKSLEEIRKLFPYNKTHSVKVVSYKGYDSIPKTRGRIDFKKMFEVKILDKDLTEKIFDILANYDNKAGIMEVAFCWDPKNGIVFLDENEKVLTYVDICFTCQLYYQPNPHTFPFFCNEKMDAVQGIMKRTGITYGMRRHESMKSKAKGDSLDVYQLVDEPPEFVGGPEAMHKFIYDNLKYPASAKKMKLEGRIFVSFIIEADGLIKYAEVLKSMGKDCDQEAIRVIRSMPKWKPGKDEGENIRVRHILPVDFSHSNIKRTN